MVDFRRNLKIRLRYDISDISISLYAKFKGNRTIRLKEKHEQTDRQKLTVMNFRLINQFMNHFVHELHKKFMEAIST